MHGSVLCTSDCLYQGYKSELSSQSHLVAASLELHQGGGDGGVLVREVHQPGLVFDRVELEQNLFVQLDPSLEDPDEHLEVNGQLILMLILC